MIEEDYHVEQEPEHKENVGKVEGQPGDDEDVAGDDGTPGSQEVRDNQNYVDEYGEYQIS